MKTVGGLLSKLFSIFCPDALIIALENDSVYLKIISRNSVNNALAKGTRLGVGWAPLLQF
jgi:hypothetical protein